LLGVGTSPICLVTIKGVEASPEQRTKVLFVVDEQTKKSAYVVIGSC